MRSIGQPQKYSKHGTTGIAATNIRGTTLQNWRDGLGFFGNSFHPLSTITLGKFQENWKDCKMIIIDEYSMLRQKELHFANERLKQIMCSDLPFGGLVVVLVGEPIVRIDAAHSGKGRQATTNQAGGLVPVLFLCINASVMLTKNVAQNAGLCNGATRKVIAIIYGSAASAPGLPLYTIVDFGSGYSGSPFFGDDPARSGWVPIFPESSEWYTPHASNPNEMLKHSRTMLPLRLCYAWTVWKVQGQTLKGKVVASLGTKEAEHGLTYTVFSRVTKASDLGIIGGFPKVRLITKVAKIQKWYQGKKKNVD